MATQWVVQTENKTKWAWERYFKTEKEARAAYDNIKKRKLHWHVRIYKETFKKES